MPKDPDNGYKPSDEINTRDASSLLNPARIYAVPTETRYLDERPGSVFC